MIDYILLILGPFTSNSFQFCAWFQFKIARYLTSYSLYAQLLRLWVFWKNWPTFISLLRSVIIFNFYIYFSRKLITRSVMGIQIFNIVYLIVLEYFPFTGKSRAALVGELERLWYARFKRIHTLSNGKLLALNLHQFGKYLIKEQIKYIRSRNWFLCDFAK